MKDIFNFLSTHKIASFTTTLPNGSLHGAALHFSHGENPLEVYFSTDKTSRKCTDLLDGKVLNSAVVIGLGENGWSTLQLDGKVQLVNDKDELEKIQSIHYAKHPGSAEFKDDPLTVFLKFTPNWWRYTNYSTDPLTITSSED